MTQTDLSPDTQAVLLLCGNLGRRGESTIKPLGPKQYSALAQWLKVEGMSPADLLTPEGQSRLAASEMSECPASRVDPLLDRGAALALVVERWQRSGIWIISRADAAYPERLMKYLGTAAPPVLYGIGSMKSLGKGGLAVVGSRDRSDEDGAFARRVGECCAREGIAIISGAAKGIDRDAMGGALESGGVVIGVLAEGVAKYATAGELREQIADGCLTLISAYEPEMRWQTWTAMERNKLLYGMSDAALVVASGEESGGTWAGATEALRVAKVRVYVKAGDSIPAGNARLLTMGASPFPAPPWNALLDLLTPLSASVPEKVAEPSIVAEQIAGLHADAPAAVVQGANTQVGKTQVADSQAPTGTKDRPQVAASQSAERQVARSPTAATQDAELRSAIPHVSRSEVAAIQADVAQPDELQAAETQGANPRQGAQAVQPNVSHPQAAKPLAGDDKTAAIRDAYTILLPELLVALNDPMEEKALADRFQVRPPQMKDWLDRALTEGLVSKTKRPVRWVIRRPEEALPPRPLPLFDAAEN